MTRAAVAGALRISIGSVRRLEGDVLHPVKADDGYWYFDAQEVEAARPKVARLRSSRCSAPAQQRGAPVDGELASRLFPLFARGATFDQVIQQTQASPPTVRALYWEWRQGYRRPPATSARPTGDDAGDPAATGEDEQTAFAAWEAEVRTVEREQARIDRLARRYERRSRNHF